MFIRFSSSNILGLWGPELAKNLRPKKEKFRAELI